MSDFDKWKDDLIKSLQGGDSVPLESYITLDEADVMYAETGATVGSVWDKITFESEVPFYMNSLGRITKHSEYHEAGGKISVLMTYAMENIYYDTTDLHEKFLCGGEVIFEGKKWFLKQYQMQHEMDHMMIDVELQRYETEQESRDDRF